jgi:hypothetical protein
VTYGPYVTQNRKEGPQERVTSRSGRRGSENAALLARVMPYFVSTDGEMPEVVSEAELEEQLKELGLPLGLIEHMQTAPAPLDPGEDPDPYGLAKESVSSSDTGK